MRQTDIAIVGGGLAGSTAAAMLGFAGIRTIVVDPHPTYPPDFRCEKLDGPQIRILRKTGLAEPVLAASTHDGHSWTARFGRLVDKRTGDQHGILYDTLVNTIRAQIAPQVDFVHAKVTALATNRDRQTLKLSNGEDISARLVVLASGLNAGLQHMLGITRDTLSPCHSVSVGFDISPVNQASFPFRSLTYYAERTAAQMAFLTLFPIGPTMRANFFVYRDFHDPWLRQLRTTPEALLHGAMPKLKALTGDFAVVGPVKIRPADLYATNGHRQPGIVLIGDAFSTSCPAAGTGTGKAFTDVERLCNIHIPNWLATEGMSVEKISAFYDDPVKRAYDSHSITKAYFVRSLAVQPGMTWWARRRGRFMVRRGLRILQETRERFVRGKEISPSTTGANYA